MPERGEFRATTDQMLELIARMQAVEHAKQEVALGSPEFLALAVEIEHVSRLAFRWAQMQLQMAETVTARVASGKIDPTVLLINVEPRPLDVILTHWREAQLRLEIAKPGSPDAQAAAWAIEGLREEYQAAHLAREEIVVR